MRGLIYRACQAYETLTCLSNLVLSWSLTWGYINIVLLLALIVSLVVTRTASPIIIVLGAVGLSSFLNTGFFNTISGFLTTAKKLRPLDLFILDLNKESFGKINLTLLESFKNVDRGSISLLCTFRLQYLKKHYKFLITKDISNIIRASERFYLSVIKELTND